MTLPKDLSHNPDLELRFRASEAFYLAEALITPSLNRIEMHATAHQIEPKVMKVLLILCARPGHVVYRDQILQPVWGQTGDDYLLNRAISELRKIFGDSAQSPVYIETIRKTGYRLLAPIKPVASAALVSEKKRPAKAADQILEIQPKVCEQPLLECEEPLPELAPPANSQRPDNRLWQISILVAACAIALVIGVKTLGTPKAFSIDHYQVYPVTHFAGREYDAALSPDGSRVAYVAERPDEPAAIFVKMLQGEQALQLSQDEGQVGSPQWMPDGQAIVYLSTEAQGLQLLRVSPMGGAPQTLFQDTVALSARGMSISRDGRTLVYAVRSALDGPHVLWMLSIASGEKSQLTEPNPGSLGDIDPLFAPDGKSLVFLRSSDEVTKDIYRLDLTNQTLTRLTHDNRKINGLAWSPDGTRLLFTSTRSGIYRLWSIDRDGGEEPRPLSLGWETVQRPSTVLGVEALVFEDWKHTAKLVTVNLLNNAIAQSEPLKMSLRWDSNPSISADGKSVVFASNRGGPFAIWQSDLNSDVAYEWANLDGAFIDNPTWSPDGKQIVFDASPDGRSQLYWLDKGASVPKPLPLGDSDNRTPSWSRDGKWIYFESNRSGSWQIYGWQVETGKIHPLAATGGKNPQESVDGQWLLFASGAGKGIRRCRKTACLQGEVARAADSAAAELVVSGVEEEDAYNWVPAREGIYFIRRQETSASPEVALFRYADGSTHTISLLPKDFRGWGMTLAPDESRLYFTEMTQPGSDIQIARP